MGLHHSSRRCRPCREITKATQGRAYYAVRLAMLGGQLKNLKAEHVPCADCGKRSACYDHRDYNRLLDVEPVCTSCNIRRGQAVAAVLDKAA